MVPEHDLLKGCKQSSYRIYARPRLEAGQGDDNADILELQRNGALILDADIGFPAGG